jgi:hypothetical protein
LETEFDDDYYLKVSIPSKHCSPLYLDFELDGRFLGSSGLLGPGLTEVLALGRVSKGSHVLRISAFGREGGCNRGALNGWGVDLVMSNNPANKSLALAPSMSVRASRQATTAPAPQVERAPAPPPAYAREAEPPREAPPLKRAPRQSSRMLVMNVSRDDLTEAGGYYLKIAVQQAKDNGVGALIVNLAPIVEMNEAGIAALEESEAIFGKGNFVIMNLRGEPRQFLETHAPGRFKVYDSKNAAVSALHR